MALSGPWISFCPDSPWRDISELFIYNARAETASFREICSTRFESRSQILIICVGLMKSAGSLSSSDVLKLCTMMTGEEQRY